MAKLPVRPINNKQRIMGCVVLFKPHDSQNWIKIGPVESVDLTPNITKVPAYSNETGAKQMIGNYVVSKDGTLSLNGVQAWTEWLHEALYMSRKKYLVQAAQTGVDYVIEDVEAGNVRELPGYKATNVSMPDGYVLDDHYAYDPSTQTLEIIHVPAGATADCALTYDLPAVTEADKILDLEMMSASGVRGELRIIGMVADGNPGDRVDCKVRDIEFTPTGALTMGGVDDINKATLEGSMYATEKGYGYLRAIDRIA